jgi:potassium-dependent mechanosensitive channel
MVARRTRLGGVAECVILRLRDPRPRQVPRREESSVKLCRVALAAVFFLVSPPPVSAQGKPSPPVAAGQTAPEAQKAPAPPTPTTIPLAEVASRATEVETLLRALGALAAPSRKFEEIRSQGAAESARLESELQRTQRILRGQPTLVWLEGAQELWRDWEFPVLNWLRELTQRATKLQDGLTRLADERQTWNRTQDAARAARAPAPILQQIAGVLAAIEQAERTLLAQRATVLDLQGRVAQGVSRCQTALAEIEEAQKQALQGLLVRDHPPLWSGESWGAWSEGFRGVRENATGWWLGVALSLRNPAEGIVPTLVLFLVLAPLLWVVRRRARREAVGEEASSLGAAVIDRPFSAALVAAVAGHFFVYGAARPVVRDLAQLLLLVPALRLTTPFVDPRVVPGLFMLGTLFVLDTARRVLADGLVFEPALLALEMLAGILVLGYALRSGDLRPSPAGVSESDRLRILRVGAGLVLLLFAATLGATVLGHMRLARLLASGVLGSAYAALILSAMMRALTGGVALVLRMWPVRLLGMVQHHRELLERRTHRVLVWIAVVVWVGRSLAYVGLLGPVWVLGKSLLAAKVERGALSISVEDVLAFVLTLWVAYLLSGSIRFALEEDVYPRIGMARGLSYALSSLLNYGLLTIGFLASLAVLGLDLTKLTVLAGAFGVGIGFGLQSMVNNFVSGLILLFERPIHVGDIIEAGDIQGTVRRIGIRASVLRTFSGAEIIVPNAQLITERVTNWTLSDRHRRVDLPVGVSYGAHPKKVVEMLETVARAHPHVLRLPAPQAFFTGFGDSSINFELRAWTDRFDEWFQIRSELATAVYDAGRAAGLTFPFPQREVRLLQDPPGRSAATATGESLAEPARTAGGPVARGGRDE